MDKFINRIYRKLLKLAGNRRPSSAPYISGDSFRALADHIFDETGTFDPKAVTHKSIVFARSDMLKEYFETIHPEIAEKYILITHNSDENIDERYRDKLDDKIIHWFAQNAMIADPRITPIPIALDNLYFSYVGDTSFFKKKREIALRNVPEKNRILYGFSVFTNPAERGPALDSLRKVSAADEIQGFIPFHPYIDKLMEYKFVASPPGNGIDSPRQWQGFYLNVIPVLKANVNTDFYVSLGLPILRVEEWSELEKFTEADLAAKYEEIMKNCNMEAIWMDYWVKRIKNEQA